MKGLAIDFEKANESPFSPCSIGLAWVENGEITKRETRFIRPKEMRFGFHQTRVHGITEENVVDAPEFPEVIREFLPELSENILLAHNASVDVQVLCSTMTVYGLPIPDFSYLCTLAIARAAWPGSPAFDLSTLANRFGMNCKHHDAGEDAVACATIAIVAARELKVTTVSDLAKKLHLEISRADRSEADWLSLRPILALETY
jgi:DNA polymerase-3 subunit epsilon